MTNNSNAYGFQSSAIAQKYADTWAAGLVHFASAGNSASPILVYPASLPIVNAVCATMQTGALASFSNYGNGLDFAAPGSQIYTTDRTGAAGIDPGDYAWAWGTSFSSPYAAGVAALYISKNPCLNSLEIEQAMQANADDFGASGYDTIFGWGQVNAASGLANLPPIKTGCDGDVVPAPCGDSLVDVQDLLAVIAGWGPCQVGQPCLSDVTGDGVVNVSDLLAVINGWGPCP